MATSEIRSIYATFCRYAIAFNAACLYATVLLVYLNVVIGAILNVMVNGLRIHIVLLAIAVCKTTVRTMFVNFKTNLTIVNANTLKNQLKILS